RIRHDRRRRARRVVARSGDRGGRGRSRDPAAWADDRRHGTQARRSDAASAGRSTERDARRHLRTDMEYVVTFWNRGAEALYGWTAEEAVGKVAHELLATVFPVPLEQIRSELIRAGRWEGELEHTRKDGTRMVVASRWTLQRDKRGAPIAMLENNNDISDRKRADEALRRQANLLEQSHDAIVVWEFPGTIVTWNRGAEQLYGFSREEAI